MANGETVTEGGGKMNTIAKKINYIIAASKKNLNFSSEIRGKLLSTDPKEVEEAEKTPRSSGKLNSIVDNLQDILNIINTSNAHLAVVNKEV